MPVAPSANDWRSSGKTRSPSVAQGGSLTGIHESLQVLNYFGQGL
ncbi:hypothetical protein [Arthrobacter sp. NtRootA1]|nr:hypothetical protein [Arthrobacter sp. NtRootA1]